MIHETISSNNLAHFKFSSQHFHKALALINGSNEIKAVAGLNKFSKLHNFDSFSHARIEICRKTALIDYFDIDAERAGEVYKDVASLAQINEALDLYYDLFFFSHRRDAGDLTKISLKKLVSITHFPRHPERELCEVADFFAVGLMDILSTSTTQFPPICRSQLCAVVMMLFDFFERQLISTFNFQDVLDLLQPDIYKYATKIYEITLIPQFKFNSAAIHCIDKTAKFMSNEEQQSSYLLYFDHLSLYSGKKLRIREGTELHIVDLAFLNAVAKGLFDEAPPREAILERLVAADYIDKIQLEEMLDRSSKRQLSQRVTESGSAICKMLYCS